MKNPFIILLFLFTQFNFSTSYAAFPIKSGTITNVSSTAAIHNNEPNDTKDANGDWASIASLACGVLSLLLIGYGGALLGIPAIIFGIIGINNNVKKGMAIAGLICGLVSVLLTIVVIIVIASALKTLFI